MGGISQLTSELRGLPDQALQQELQQPSGMVPSYLVLAEAQRRQLMRQAAQKQQSGQSSTVLQDVVKNMMAQQPPPGIAPAGMTPPRTGGMPQPSQMPTPAPPQGMAKGGPLRFAAGGADTGEDDETEDAPQPPSPQGEADRAMQPVNVDDLAEAMIQFEGSRLPSSPGFHANNPGHLKYVGQPGTLGHDAHGFAQFPSWEAGLAAMKNQLRRNLAHGLTLSEMIGGKKGVYGGWAPASDHNNTANYIKYVAKQTGYDQNTLMSEANVAARNVKPAWSAAPSDYAIAPPEKAPAPQFGYAPPGTDLYGDLPTTDRQITPAPQPLTPDQVEPDQPTQADRQEPAAPQAQPQAAPQQPQIIPSAPAYDPWSPANIDRMRQLRDTIYGGDQGLAQERAATIQQLQGMRNELLARYHNPSPWEFLSNIAAGMGQSKSLNFAGMFGEGVGLAWQRRDAEQQQMMSDATQLQQQILGIQNTAESERERMGGALVQMLTKPPQGVQEFEKFLGLPGVQYGRKENAPGQDYAFKEDPGQPGWGAWVPTGKALKAAQKPGSRADQEFNAATKNLAGMIGLPEDTTYGDLPQAFTLKKQITVPEDMPNPDGTIIKAGTVLPAGTTIYPQRMAQNLADRGAAEKAGATSAQRLLSTREGRMQIAADPNWMPGHTPEQAQRYIDTGKMPENIDSLAMDVANYVIPLRDAMSRGALSDRNALIAKVRQINPNYNEGEQEAQYKNFTKTEGNFGTGAQGKQIQTTATLVHHLGVLYDAAQALKDGGTTGDFRALNKIAKDLNMQLGATPQDTFRAIVHAVGPETTKAYIASGGTFADRAEVEKDFGEDLPPDALMNNVASRARLLGGVMQPLVQDYVNNTYGRGTRHLGFYTPDTIGELHRIAPNAVKTVTKQQVQQWANQYFNGNFEAAQKHMADSGYFLRP